MIAALLFVSFAVLLVLGTPIAVCLGSSSVLAMLAQGAGRPVDTIMSSLPFLFSASSSKFVLLAIPFFILSGIGLLGMGYLASRNSDSALMNWIEEIVNCVAQGSLLIGTLILKKAGLREFRLSGR